MSSSLDLDRVQAQGARTGPPVGGPDPVPDGPQTCGRGPGVRTTSIALERLRDGTARTLGSPSAVRRVDAQHFMQHEAKVLELPGRAAVVGANADPPFHPLGRLGWGGGFWRLGGGAVTDAAPLVRSVRAGRLVAGFLVRVASGARIAIAAAGAECFCCASSSCAHRMAMVVACSRTLASSVSMRLSFSRILLQLSERILGDQLALVPGA